MSASISVPVSPTEIPALYLPGASLQDGQLSTSDLLPYTEVRCWSTAAPTKPSTTPRKSKSKTQSSGNSIKRKRRPSRFWESKPSTRTSTDEGEDANCSKPKMPRFSFSLSSLDFGPRSGVNVDRRGHRRLSGSETHDPAGDEVDDAVDDEKEKEKLLPIDDTTTAAAATTTSEETPAATKTTTTTTNQGRRKSSLAKLKNFLSNIVRKDSAIDNDNSTNNIEEDETPLSPPAVPNNSSSASTTTTSQQQQQQQLYFTPSLEPLARAGLLRFTPTPSLPSSSSSLSEDAHDDGEATAPCSSTYWRGDSYHFRPCTLVPPLSEAAVAGAGGGASASSLAALALPLSLPTAARSVPPR